MHWSEHPLERCNAAQVFMHVFPLEKWDCSYREMHLFGEKQFKEILDLLKDDYYFVRIIAIKGVCYHLMELLEGFSNVELKILLTMLANNLANDGSSYMVRLAVFEGFAEMVKKKESAQLLESILPQMKNHVYDENEKVRCAFVMILQNVNDFLESMSINYWDIVPIDHLAARLELEGSLVGELLVKLVINNFYEPGGPLVVSRVIRLVKMNPKAARQLFQFSAKILTVKDIYAIIIALLGYLSQKAKETLEEVHKENDENVASQFSDSPVNRRKRKKSKEVLADFANLHIDNNNKSNDSRNEEVSEIESGSATNGEGSNGNALPSLPFICNPSAPPPEEVTDELVICRGVLEAACTAWLVFSEQLNLLENEQYLADLYTLAVATIPLFLRCYKEKEIQSLDQLKDQPFMVELIMKFLLTNSPYCVYILPTFVKLFNKYSQDGLCLGSCFSLLNTVVRTSNKKYRRVDLEKVMQIAFQTLDEYKKTSSHHTRVKDSMDSSFCSEEMLMLFLSLCLLIGFLVNNYEHYH